MLQVQQKQEQLVSQGTLQQSHKGAQGFAGEWSLHVNAVLAVFGC